MLLNLLQYAGKWGICEGDGIVIWWGEECFKEFLRGEGEEASVGMGHENGLHHRFCVVEGVLGIKLVFFVGTFGIEFVGMGGKEMWPSCSGMGCFREDS